MKRRTLMLRKVLPVLLAAGMVMSSCTAFAEEGEVAAEAEELAAEVAEEAAPAAEEAEAAPEEELTELQLVYRDLLLRGDYGDETVYVVGHQNPDSDTVGSAISYAYLLNQIGISAQAVTNGPINNETKYALEQFGMEAPEVMQDATGKKFVLVDHTVYLQSMPNMKNAQIVGIVDHHGLGDVTESEPLNIRVAPVGATASLVYLAYQECGVTIPKDIASVTLMSLMSDTENMTISSVTKLDELAYRDLLEISEIEDVNALFEGMSEAFLDYTGMTDEQIYKQEYKDYEAQGVRFGIGVVNATGEEEMKELGDRMYSYLEENWDDMGLDMAFAIIQNNSDDESENGMYITGYPVEALDVLAEAFDTFDGSRYVISKEIVSRKKGVVPKITEVLDNNAYEFDLDEEDAA